MTRPAYWIQIATYRHAGQTLHRAQVMQGQLAIATTVQAWPENAGCGRAAAIGQANQVIGALHWQDQETAPLSTKSLNSFKQQTFNDSSKWLLWGFACWYVIIAVVGACR